jgi:hypothetical protein
MKSFCLDDLFKAADVAAFPFIDLQVSIQEQAVAL